MNTERGVLKKEEKGCIAPLESFRKNLDLQDQVT